LAPSQTGPVVNGIVVALDDLMATVELGDGREEWVFPRDMLPADVSLDSHLTFAGSGQTRVLDHRPPAPSVEDRLGRALNRRRLSLDEVPGA
jgi:hypothetical protein